MWRCDMPLAEYKHGRVGTLMQCFNCSSGHNRVRQWLLQENYVRVSLGNEMNLNAQSNGKQTKEEEEEQQQSAN